MGTYSDRFMQGEDDGTRHPVYVDSNGGNLTMVTVDGDATPFSGFAAPSFIVGETSSTHAAGSTFVITESMVGKLNHVFVTGAAYDSIELQEGGDFVGKMIILDFFTTPGNYAYLWHNGWVANVSGGAFDIRTTAAAYNPFVLLFTSNTTAASFGSTSFGSPG